MADSAPTPTAKTHSRLPGAHDADRPPLAGFTLRFLAGIFVFAGLLGAFAYVRFMQSEKYIGESHKRMLAAGAALSPEQCAHEVVAWRAECPALNLLCDAGVMRIADGCLSGADRTAYCASVGDATASTEFGYDECRQYETDRKKKKTCGSMFRAIDTHCRRLASEGAP
ncbi:MAG: hypothetical protein K8I29_08625 [Alphaproteobacteria bacterium]|uniref:Uncharacterized protein n=1 Tax=Candidatus Nitrobium versatile TaxID=2884831 RepID=A0A953LWT1_9BACT|nr:hypothetical protein [Candidatus Nitrobium versatile]